MTPGDKARILFLAPFPPRLDGPHGGSRVLAEVLCRLSATHRAALMYLRSGAEMPCDPCLRSLCEFVEEVGRPGRGHSRADRYRWWAGLARSLLKGQPMWVGDWSVPAFRTALERVLAGWKPDIIQAEYHIMGQYVADLKGPWCHVLTEYEPGVAAAAERFRESRGIRKMIYRADLQAWQRYERALVERIDRVVAFTERDRRQILDLAPHARVARIPIAAHVPERPLHVPRGPLNVLFIGNFVHPPNVDASLRLMDRIFPLVRSRCESAELIILGDGATSGMLKRAQRTGNVRVAGRVDDVKPWIERASVMVAPLRLGGGMRVKVLEALAYGKPLIASSLAVEGLEVANGRDFLLAESDEEFAGNILDLLRNPAKRDTLAHNAWLWARANLSWQKTAESYERLYRELEIACAV